MSREGAIMRYNAYVGLGDDKRAKQYAEQYPHVLEQVEVKETKSKGKR